MLFKDIFKTKRSIKDITRGLKDEIITNYPRFNNVYDVWVDEVLDGIEAKGDIYAKQMDVGFSTVYSYGFSENKRRINSLFLKIFKEDRLEYLFKSNETTFLYEVGKVLSNVGLISLKDLEVVVRTAVFFHRPDYGAIGSWKTKEDILRYFDTHWLDSYKTVREQYAKVYKSLI